MQLEEIFLDKILESFLSNKKLNTLERDVFRLRFSKKNEDKTHGEIAKEIEKKRDKEGRPIGNFTNSINTTVQQVVHALADQYEEEIRVDGFDSLLWRNTKRGGKVEGKDGRFSPWKDAFLWLWEKKYHCWVWSWVWEQLIVQAREAGEQITLREVSISAGRTLDIPEMPRFVVLKDRPYQLYINLKRNASLLVLGQSTSGKRLCYCPSQAFAPTNNKISASEPTVLPESESPAAVARKYFTYREVGEEWVLAIVTSEQLNRSWTNVGGTKWIHELTAASLIDLWEQLQQQPDAELFFKLFEVTDV